MKVARLVTESRKFETSAPAYKDERLSMMVGK